MEATIDQDDFLVEDFAEVLGMEVEGDFFEYDIPAETNFKIPKQDCEYLKAIQRGRYLQRGQWQDIFLKHMKTINPYCCFVFKHHQVSSCNGFKFSAYAKCKFQHCAVEVRLVMSDDECVQVKCFGNVKHKLGEIHARPIRGMYRERLTNDFKCGIKPLTKYLNIFSKFHCNQIKSGNLDSLGGQNTSVFRKISSQSRETRFNCNEIESLSAMKIKMIEDNKEFIQKICADPMYILYWSEEGLAMYHKFGSKYPLFWDATGSVVRRSLSGKAMLYYEMAMKNPITGDMGIPLTAMLSADQSLPTVMDWLNQFLNAEKRKFGHNRCIQPKIIISDQSWVLILSALKIFNCETLLDFLTRLWDEFRCKRQCGCKTVVYLCRSHFMNKVKRFCLKHYRKNLKFGLYVVSLLLNCKTLADASSVLNDIFVCLLSPYILPTNCDSINRLIFNINRFECDSKHSSDLQLVEDDEHTVQPGIFTEEDFLNRADSSPFKKWAGAIFNDVKENLHLISDKSDQKGIELVRNPYHSELFANEILTRYLPIFPLWSIVSLITCFSNDQQVTEVRTSSTIENRFRILKHIALSNKTQSRVDDFTAELVEHTIAVQRLCCKLLKAELQAQSEFTNCRREMEQETKDRKFKVQIWSISEISN